MKHFQYLLLLPLILFINTGKAQDAKVLFIGNSYTYVNDLPGMFDSLSTHLGKTVSIGSKTNGGFTFQNQWNDPATYTAIHQQDWDVVVLQAQSQEPSFPYDQVTTNTLPFAIDLSDSVYAAHACSNVMYYMTWGRKTGDPQWDSINTFDKMNARLYDGYMRFANATSAMVSPVAIAWKNIRDNHPEIELYASDGSHPSVAGTYLVANTFYAAIFRESPVGTTYLAGLDPTTAGILQQAAVATVMDSEEVYHLHDISYRTVADFNWNINPYGELSVNSMSTLATNYHWNFGDGTTSTDQNPTHQYPQPGTYTVELIASSDCNSDTLTAEIVVSTVGVDENQEAFFEVYPNPVSLTLEIRSNNTGTAQLYDSKGILVKNIELTSQNTLINIENLEKGVYFIQLENTSIRFVKQ